MKKIIILGLVLTFIAPHIVLASWWNPFSWNIFNKQDQKTLILENKVKELETRLNNANKTTEGIRIVELKSSSVSKKTDNIDLLTKQNKVKQDKEALLLKQKSENQIKEDLFKNEEQNRVNAIRAKIEANQLKINELRRQYSQGTLPLNRDQQEAIDATQQSFNNAIAQQKIANQSYENTVKISSYRSGSEYTPDVTSSIITNVATSNNSKISELENKAQLAISSMKLKYLEINYQTLLEYYNDLGRQLEQSL